MYYLSRNDDMADIASILTNLDRETYEIKLSQTLGQRDLFKDMFHSMRDDLGELNRENTQRIAWILDRPTFKILVIFLTDKVRGHKRLISRLRTSLFAWDEKLTHCISSKNKTKEKDEYEQLLKWLMSRLTFGYHSDIFPSRQSVFPVEKVLYAERYSASVATKLYSKLANFRQHVSFETIADLSVITIDGANREVLKYKPFVQKTVETFTNDSRCSEIFFIISVEDTDEINTVRDILPASVVPKSKVYTAYDPERVCPLCILIHINPKGKF